MTRISRLGGRLQSTDAPQVHDDLNAIEETYFAAATIPAGTIVMLDTTDVHARYVTKATVAGDHTALGLYTGEGGKGSASSDYGVGRTALPGDEVVIRRRGAMDALVIALTTTAITVRDTLIITTTTVDGIAAAAILNRGAGAEPTAPGLAPFVALEALTTGTATSKIAVLFRA